MNTDIVKTLVAGTVMVALLGVLLVGGTTLQSQDDVPITDGAGTIESQYDGDISNVTVESTTGDAVSLDGSGNAGVNANLDVSLGDSWSACTYAAVDPGAENETRSVLALDTDRYEIVLTHNGSTQQWEAWYWDAATTQSHAAAVAAPDPTNRTLVCATRNASAETLTVSRNTTVGAQTNTATGGFADRANATAWDGWLEETRLYPTALNDSQRQRWVNEPVLAVNGTAPVARITYDTREWKPDSVSVYFADSSASLSSAQIVDGASGPDLEAGVDYELAGLVQSWLAGGDIVVLDGSNKLTGNGDVVYTTFDVEVGAFNLVRLGAVLFVFLFLAVKIQDLLP